MNTKNRTVRAGFAALALAAGLVAVAGPAAAEIPLTPATADPIWGATTGPIPTGSAVAAGQGSSQAGLPNLAGPLLAAPADLLNVLLGGARPCTLSATCNGIG
ncbi:hypothetical protein [Nocardia sp. NPDC051981]|uniref:hypothetical protein n=1 Tax=unclassified Nocardia TaxID=2637762 RepID=UPI00343AF377